MRKANKFISKMALTALSIAGFTGLVAPNNASAWGDNFGMRESNTYEGITEDAKLWGTGKIVFNTISNSTIGDEKNFVGARLFDGKTSGKDNVWNGNDIDVENGKEYIVRLYVHNNNPNGAVANGVRVAFDIPNYSAKDIEVNGFIFTNPYNSGAAYDEYWDYVRFHSTNAFHLEYVKGSALIENNDYGKNGGKPLSDEIVTSAKTTNGILIGYSALDGKVPGCYQYASYVTIRVKAVFDTDYTVKQEVRLAGTTEWKNNVEAKVGDKVEFQFEYQNTSLGETQMNVMVKDILSKNLKYVPGSTLIWNDEHSGAQITPDGNLFSVGHNIASYTPGANAYIRFTAEVVDENLAEGVNTLVNWSQVGVGAITMQDSTTVTVKKATTTPPELPSTGPEAIVGGVIAAGSIVTAAGYYFASRRALR